MNSPLVSIIILNWNGKELIRECIDSVLKSHYSPLEIILADNGSTDGSVEFVRSQFPSVIILENNENWGYAEGNNRGIKITQGKYVVTLNNDVVVDPDWLKKPIEYLENDPRIGSVCCRQMNYYDQSVIDSLFHYPSPELIFDREGHGEKYDPHSFASAPGYVIAPNGGSAVYRKSMFMELGGFDGNFFAYHDEADLSMRVFLFGWKCLYVPDSVVYHKEGISFKKTKGKATYYHERNRMWFIFKFFPCIFILKNFYPIFYDELRNIKNYVLLGNAPLWYFKARIHGFLGMVKYFKVRNLFVKKFLIHQNEFLLLKKQKIIKL